MLEECSKISSVTPGNTYLVPELQVILLLDKQHEYDFFQLSPLKGRVVENISKRCGGFLRKLSLRGCIGVGDSSLK